MYRILLQENGYPDVDVMGDLNTELERALGKVVKERYGTDFFILHRCARGGWQRIRGGWGAGGCVCGRRAGPGSRVSLATALLLIMGRNKMHMHACMRILPRGYCRSCSDKQSLLLSAQGPCLTQRERMLPRCVAWC